MRYAGRLRGKITIRYLDYIAVISKPLIGIVEKSYSFYLKCYIQSVSPQSVSKFSILPIIVKNFNSLEAFFFKCHIIFLQISVKFRKIHATFCGVRAKILIFAHPCQDRREAPLKQILTIRNHRNSLKPSEPLFCKRKVYCKQYRKHGKNKAKCDCYTQHLNYIRYSTYSAKS